MQLVSTTNDLKKALTDVEKIMDSSLDIICSIDEDGRFVSVSSAAKSIWGYHPHELKGSSYMDLVFAADKEITTKVAREYYERQCRYHVREQVCKERWHNCTYDLVGKMGR